MRVFTLSNWVRRGVPWVCLIAGSLAIASATPVGVLNVDSAGGGVIVGNTFIDWFPPTGPPDGPIQVAGGGSFTFSGGSLAAGTQGRILDLTAPTSFPVANFITFPGVSFSLTSIGPGSSNLDCAGATAVGGSCSVFAGSPFVLTSVSTGTGVTLALTGVGTDATGSTSYLGTFTTQLSGVTPADVQNLFLSNPDATITSSHSGQLVLSEVVIPEPGTWVLTAIGTTLALLGVLRRRATQRP